MNVSECLFHDGSQGQQCYTQSKATRQPHVPVARITLRGLPLCTGVVFRFSCGRPRPLEAAQQGRLAAPRPSPQPTLHTRPHAPPQRAQLQERHARSLVLITLYTSSVPKGSHSFLNELVITSAVNFSC